MRLRLRRRAPSGRRFGARRILLLVAKLVGLLVALSVVSVLVLRVARPLTTAVMVERRVAALLNGRPYHLQHQWVGWNRISPQAALAVIASEDQKFGIHNGFDVAAIHDAIEAHERGRRLRGASTISQQVAKNLFLWSGRSFVRKGLEAYFTTLIELTWSKRRILETYLNIVELGDGVFGVEAASRRYFRKPASRLRPDEAALLAAVLPNPLRFHVDRPSAYVQQRREWILGQMAQLGGTGLLKAFD